MDIKGKNINISYGSLSVLEDVSFSVEQGDVIGLVGRNGVGKSTLLRVMAGLIEPDSGEVSFKASLGVGYMPQVISPEVGERAGMDLRDKLSQRATSNNVRQVLAGLGLEDSRLDLPLSNLSPGERSKVCLASLLLSEPDVLLLDEPTNNLDIVALEWLEDYLVNSKTTKVVISHDRVFLDKIVGKIYEIDWHTRGLNISRGKYSDYIERKRKERENQIEEYDKYIDEQKRLLDSARSKKEFAIKGSKYVQKDGDKRIQGYKREKAARSARAAKAIEARVDKLEPVSRPISDRAFTIEIEELKPGASKIFKLSNLVCGYKSGYKSRPYNLDLEYGDRLAIIGPNGSGKSTLLKTISGEIDPQGGVLEISPIFSVGNLTQEHQDMPDDLSVYEYISNETGLDKEHIYNLAVRYGFKPEEVSKNIKDLSPGGKSRLLFAVFSAKSVNILLLDEPTNHLDLEALDALEMMLDAYTGTVILVSHDRYLLSKFKANKEVNLFDV